MAGEYVIAAGKRGALMGLGVDYRLAAGKVTMSAGSLGVITGLKTVVAAAVCLEDDPVTGALGARLVTCDIQTLAASTPGSLFLKLWDELGVAATAFGTGGMDVSWIAIGT